MLATPFHFYSLARELAGLNSDQSFIAAYASADIEIYPYQIAAAGFALRSNHLRGCVLCDEGSLGKSYEGLLIATQKWYEGKDRQLLILPINMVDQWIKKIEKSFSIPYVLINTKEDFDKVETENPFEQNALVITTYDFAVEKADYIKRLNWDLIIFDEADCLNKVYTEESKTANILKDATDGSFKILLTPMPIEMDIRDIYGLVYFIDKYALPDIDEFYSTYFRKPENYPDLAKWVSRYCFRTLKSQVIDYANFTNRIPYTVSCENTKEEKNLYERLNDYLSRSVKIAYPKMEVYNLTLDYFHTLSSSAQALVNTLNGVIKRLGKVEVVEKHQQLLEEEIQLITEIKSLTEKIDINGKTKMLLTVIKKGFARLKKLKYEQKTIVFVDNLTTMAYLYEIFISEGYRALTYSGGNSRDYSVMERFRSENAVQILISTDEAAKGLDIEFCPLVVNYDILSNATTMEQRISRCHRQGQQSDVMVINLVNNENFADIRYIELINKRVLQFDGIFGLSDKILGNFDVNFDDLLSKMRAPKEIFADFKTNLETHQEQNEEIVEVAENQLFTTFTKEISDKVMVTPQYIKEKSTEINIELWEIVKYYFEKYNERETDCYFEIDEQNKTVTATNYGGELPVLFNYYTGSQNRPYRSQKAYGMGSDFKPHAGKITLTSILGRTILSILECADNGNIIVDEIIEPCTIGLYSVAIYKKVNHSQIVMKNFDMLIGKKESGGLLSDDECKKIMNMPVLEYSTDERVSSYWLREVTGGPKPHELDRLIPEQTLIIEYLSDQNPVDLEEIESMKLKTIRAKTLLERSIGDLESKIEGVKIEAQNTTDRMEKMSLEKKLALLQRDLRKKKDSIYSDEMRLDIELQKQIDEMTNSDNFTINSRRHFLLNIEGR